MKTLMAAKPKRSSGGRKISKRPIPFFKLKLNKRNKILDSKVWIQRQFRELYESLGIYREAGQE